MQQIDAIFTLGDEIIALVPTPMTPANLDELCAEMGHSMTLVSSTAPDLANALARLLASNASHEGDWLREATRLLLVITRAAMDRGATAVRFEAKEVEGPFLLSAPARRKAPQVQLKPLTHDTEGIYNAVRGIVFELAEAIGPERALVHIDNLFEASDIPAEDDAHAQAIDALAAALVKGRVARETPEQIVARLAKTIEAQDAAMGEVAFA